MRILVLAPQWPDPPRQGAAIRNLHIILYLARRHRVTLLTFAPDGETSMACLKEACDYVEVLPAPSRSSLERLRTLLTSSLPDMAWRLRTDTMLARVRDLVSQTRFDAIHIEGIEMAPYALAAVAAPNDASAARAHHTMLVYDAHNAEYLLQRRAFTTDMGQSGPAPKALYSLAQWWRLRSFEREVCLASKHVIAVSQTDRDALVRLSPGIGERVKVLPNGVDPSYWSRDAGFATAPTSTGDPGNTLVFDGSMDFRPNVDAVRWFATQVWPLIREHQPQARFYIVGRNPTAEVQALGNNNSNNRGITVTGTVDDPRSWVAAADVYVVPMRMGGGVRLKVLQAMAMGCALVSTPMGIEGIDVQPGKEVVIAGTAQTFARSTLELLSDPQRRRALGSAARETAATLYAWDVLLPTLDRVYPLTVA